MKKEEVKKMVNSFKYAGEGVKTSFKSERNMKIHILIACLVVIFAFIFKITLIEWLICLVLFGLVISLELVNTAIEATVDICMPKIDPRAKKAKDIAAGAVLFSAIISVIIGILIFLPKLINFIK